MNRRLPFLPFFKKRIPFLSFFIVVLFSFQVFHIISLKSKYAAVDLRNRITGARVLKNKPGISPYYYKWNKADGDAFLDLYDTPSFTLNRNTVTPFLLQLLSPIVGFSFSTLSWVWFFDEVSILLLCALLFYSSVKDPDKKFGILFISFVAIGSSQGFLFHAVSGQVYIFYTLLLTLVYFLFNRSGILIEICTAILLCIFILIRPIAFVFLIPFIIKKRLRILFYLTGFILLYFGYEFLSGGLWIWKSYMQAMHDWSYEFFQPPVPLTYEELNITNHIEGSGIIKASPLWHISEDSSLRGFIFRFFHIKLLTKELMVAAGIAAASSYLFLRKKIFNADVRTLFIYSFLLYFIAEICLPAIRNSYNYVQWLFPLLLIVTGSRQKPSLYILLLSGTLLALGVFKFLPFDLTLAELIFATMCFYFINDKTLNA